MKRYFKVLMILIIFLVYINTNALTASEIESRNVCSNIELATANIDGSITSIACFDDFNSAKEALNKSDNDDVIILERKNNKTRIIDAKWALVYLDIGNVITDYYASSDLKTATNYMNHSSTYGGTDGVYLGINYSNYAVKVKIAGFSGWIKNGAYTIVPMNFVKQASYYQITNTEIIHYYGKNIQTTYSPMGRAIGPKPSNISIGTYYSYDGNYFYTNLKDLAKDYRSETYNNSINKSNPYYNYYLYLPHRAVSNYSSDDIDSYLRNTKGFIGSIYSRTLISKYSNLYGTGIYFKASEKIYGANAILVMGLSMNESASGQSTIAIDKNNIFGHNAYDASPYQSSTGYLDVYSSILIHGYSYINCGYARPTDSRYYGSHIGNKASGMGVKYASDPYWGEKAANYYYLFDKDNGMSDYNYYQLGMTNNKDLMYFRSEPRLSASATYSISGGKQVPVIIIEEVIGDTYLGSNKWYKVVSDANLTTARTNLQTCNYGTNYNWNSYLYVHSSLIDKINNSTYKNPSTVNVGVGDDYTYKQYATTATSTAKAVFTPKVALLSADSAVYFTSTLSTTTGATIKKGHLVTIFMEAQDKNGKTVAYLVETDYSKNQRHWIKASNLDFVNKDILSTYFNTKGDYINVYNEPGGNVLGSFYTDTYSVIIDKKTYSNDLWIKVHYNISNTYGWINTNISSSKGTLTYTLNYLNQLPVITASNVTVMLGDTIDVMKYASATDAEDGNLTKNIKVTSNNVNINKSGSYSVTYSVTDSYGSTVTKTITITVKDYLKGTNLFIYNSLKYISGDTFNFSGFLGVKGMDNINVTHYLVFKNQMDGTTYKFEAGKFTNYPYEMSSLDDDRAYNYSGGWFNINLDLSKTKIKQGDYNIYIQAFNKDKGYYTETYFTNIAYMDMARRVNTTNRGFYFEVDYSYLGSPILMSVRDNGLISSDVPGSMDPMYNFFNEIKLTNNNLYMLGTSHNYGVSYSKNDNVSREIVFENTNTFERVSYDVGSITNGLYTVQLTVSDNKDKTRAWFEKTMDLSKLKTGTYAIYIKTTTNNKTYYGELIDVAYTNFTKLNTSKYIFNRNEDKRLRLELIVK